MNRPMARRVGEPRVTPLAGCLAAALAFGSGAFPAAHAKTFHPAIDQVIERFGPLDAVRRPPLRQPSVVTLHEPVRPGRRHPAVPTGNIVPVTNCNDDGPGSLRDAIDSVAVSGDTIDLTHTGCSTITLTTGSIFIGQTDLTLQGPGRSLIIDGNGAYSLRHIGSGALEIHDLSIVDGRKYSSTADAKGGCIYSHGTATLVGAYLKYCRAETADPNDYSFGGAVYGREGVIAVDTDIVLSDAGGAGVSAGGAVYTPGDATIAYSRIGMNFARDAGGGVFARDGLYMKYSSVFDNEAGVAGGTYGRGNVFITNSTIAGNRAGFSGAALLDGTGAAAPITLTNSTVSGNTALAFGGLLFRNYPARVSNSTIAFNSESNYGNYRYGAGFSANSSVELQSSIVARNTLQHSVYGPLPDDMGGNGVLTGSNNATEFVVPPLVAPPGTLYGNPYLASLSYNGGLTPTHALQPTSPCIDAGNNVTGLSVDQRGPGFPRVIGANTDIGAFELDLDLIFADGFD